MLGKALMRVRDRLRNEEGEAGGGAADGGEGK